MKKYVKHLVVTAFLALVHLSSLAQFPSNLDLSTLDGNNGFVINDVSGLAGFSVSDAGDVNGDGIDDVILGAPFSGPDTNRPTGVSYVVYGTNGGFTGSIDLSSLDGIDGFTLNGISPDDVAGWSVSTAGDVNADGFDDMIIGAHDVETSGGNTYVVFGSDQNFPPFINLSDLNGINGFTLGGTDDYDLTGWSVSTAGDVNGDGFDDVIIGAPFADPNGSGSGSNYVVFGKSAFSNYFDLSTLDGSNGFTLHGASRDELGHSVSGAGDVNGDGIDDLVFGAPLEHSSYVLFGTTMGFPSTINSFDLNGDNGFTLNGIAIGWFVSTAGDVNDDGIDDLIIGAFGAESNPVVFGDDGIFTDGFEQD